MRKGSIGCSEKGTRESWVKSLKEYSKERQEHKLTGTCSFLTVNSSHKPGRWISVPGELSSQWNSMDICFRRWLTTAGSVLNEARFN